MKESKIEREMSNYITIEIDPSTVGNPLVWWRDNQKHYPRLAQLTRKFLCIPATSVPSERAFSVAGHVVNEKRACLLPENVNMLVFVGENLEVDKKKDKCKSNNMTNGITILFIVRLNLLF